MNQNTQQAVDRVEHFAKTWRWQRDKQDIADVQDGPDTCVVLAIADLDVLISERKKPIANLERTESERDTARALLSQEYGRLRPALDYLQQHHAQFDATAGQRFTSIIGEWFPKLAERAKQAEEATQSTRYVHVKTGGLYDLKQIATLEADGTSQHAVYRSVETGQVWVRPMSEFFAKFVEVIALEPAA